VGSNSVEHREALVLGFMELFNVECALGNEEDSLFAIRQACLILLDLGSVGDPRRSDLPPLDMALSRLLHAPRPFSSDESSRIQGARETLDIRRKLHEFEPGDLLAMDRHAFSLLHLAEAFEESGLPNDAAKTAQDAVDIFRRYYCDRQLDRSFLSELAMIMLSQAELLIRIGRIDEALSVWGNVSLYIAKLSPILPAIFLPSDNYEQV
jgi:hypothetical protein